MIESSPLFAGVCLCQYCDCAVPVPEHSTPWKTYFHRSEGGENCMHIAHGYANVRALEKTSQNIRLSKCFVHYTVFHVHYTVFHDTVVISCFRCIL